MPKSKSSNWIRDFCAGKNEVVTMNIETNTITFAAATTGAKAAKELFKVNGLVLCTIFGECIGTSLTGSGTICVGTANDTDLIIGNATATSIDAGDVFIDATAIGQTEEWASDLPWILTNNQDLAYEVKTATITAGVIKFYCLWYALSNDAAVVPSGSNAAV